MLSQNLQKPAPRTDPDDLPVEILNPQQSAQYYSLTMPKPAGPLKEFVDHYWIMRWDLPGDTSFTAEIIPSPYINVTCMPGGSVVTGVTTGKYTYEVKGSGVIVGAKFYPGGYHVLTGQPAADVTDTTIPAAQVFAEITPELNDLAMRAETNEQAVALLESALSQHLVQPDSAYRLVREITSQIKHGDCLTVRDITEQYHLSERRLQELFQYYVGVGAKWVILRYRLLRATRHAHTSEDTNWTRLATELGYSDQSHFINDFKRIIGLTPKQYSSSQRHTADS